MLEKGKGQLKRGTLHVTSSSFALGIPLMTGLLLHRVPALHFLMLDWNQLI